MAKKQFSHHTWARLGFGLILTGGLLAIIAVVIYIHQSHALPKPPPGAMQSSATPSSAKPTAPEIASYSVPADNPKYLAIPALGITKTRVLGLGLLSEDQRAVPDNIYDTGWYENSSKPGQPGAMFVYGHVSSWTSKGVFYNLKSLKPGNIVTIVRGDNKAYTYQVVSTKIYPYNNVDMNQVLTPINPGKPGLNLMTCTGQVIKGTSEFNERLVVFTSLVSS